MKTYKHSVGYLLENSLKQAQANGMCMFQSRNTEVAETLASDSIQWRDSTQIHQINLLHSYLN